MLTIMTPTYNRGYILEKAYESLLEQTSNEFEWIIVDDGSKDNTEELVSEWKESKKIDIVYLKKDNGGKHRAINYGIKYARGEYILILDSDDYLTFDAVESILKWTHSIQDLDGFAGVAGLKGWINQKGVIGNQQENAGFIDATNIERIKYGLMGDKAEVYSVNILRQYPFPEFEGENFIRENVVWDKIALDGYKLRWFNRVIYKCEYLEDGLTKGASEELYKKNFRGYILSTKMALEYVKFPHDLIRIGQMCSIARKKDISVDVVCGILNKRLYKGYIGLALYWIRNFLR